MSADPLTRVAVIGAGAMANSVHYPSLASFKDVEIVGVCDIDEGRLAATAERYGIPGRYSDYRDMIEKSGPDGVYAIGPPEVMYPIWTWCLSHGCNLYIEKPMGLTMHQAEILLYLADEAGVITQVSHQRRCSPLLGTARAECEKHGPITHAICEFYKHAPSPMLSAKDHMMDDCTHSIDTLRWMCGGEVVAVDSHCRRIGTPDINWIGATLEFDNGSIGYLVNSWASGRRVFRVQMHAPGIAVDAEVEGKAHIYADGDYTGVELDCKTVAGSDENFVYGGFQAKNREFIDSIRTGVDTTSSPFRDCIKTMQVAELILAQALASAQIKLRESKE